MNKQKSQAGFAHLMILVIILSLGLVGSLGYIYWQNFVKKDNNISQQNSSNDKKDADDNKSVDVTVNWTKLDTDYFTMPIPDGWKLTKITMADTGKSNISVDKYGLSAEQALTYKVGERAVIDNSVESGGHGLGGRSLYIGYVDKNVDCSTSGYDSSYIKATDMRMNNGLAISKYQKTYDALPESMVEVPAIEVGTIVYIYTFETNKGCASVSYYVAPTGQTNNVAQLEQALKAVAVK